MRSRSAARRAEPPAAGGAASRRTTMPASTCIAVSASPDARALKSCGQTASTPSSPGPTSGGSTATGADEGEDTAPAASRASTTTSNAPGRGSTTATSGEGPKVVSQLISSGGDPGAAGAERTPKRNSRRRVSDPCHSPRAVRSTTGKVRAREVAGDADTLPPHGGACTRTRACALAVWPLAPRATRLKAYSEPPESAPGATARVAACRPPGHTRGLPKSRTGLPASGEASQKSTSAEGPERVPRSSNPASGRTRPPGRDTATLGGDPPTIRMVVDAEAARGPLDTVTVIVYVSHAARWMRSVGPDSRPRSATFP
mmetsp:Transcript_15883/g.49917  ORF Transcript_15883/g.49917 Transcript_15883/m.49917 type:complete len:315 (-) Transcript_15883:666-1610(-)